MSLLFGFGRGLSDAAMMINRGMAEDRQSARQLELEKMREASIEKRWSRETAMRQSERQADREQRASELEANRSQRATERAEEMEYRKGRDAQSDNQFNRQMSMREKQVIEGNLGGVMEQEGRAAEKIRAAFAKQLESGMGDPAQINADMQAQLEANQMFYSQKLHNMIQSYGSKLKGTGFEYLLNVKPDLNESAAVAPENATQGQRDLSGYVSNIMDQGDTSQATANNKEISPWLTGFNYGTKGVYGDDAKTPPDVSELSLLDQGFYQGGRSAGLLFGLPKDAGQYASDRLKPLTQRLTETPEQRRLRISQNNGR